MQEAQKLKCVSACLGHTEEEDRPRIAVRGSFSPGCKIGKPNVREQEEASIYAEEAYILEPQTRASVSPPHPFTMFISSDPWTALTGNNVHQYSQPKPQVPFYHGLLGGVAVCDSHLVGLKGWYWAQAVALWKAQQTMAHDNWMSGSEAGEVRYPFTFYFFFHGKSRHLFSCSGVEPVLAHEPTTPHYQLSHLPFPTARTKLPGVFSDISSVMMTRTPASDPRTSPYKTRSGSQLPAPLSTAMSTTVKSRIPSIPHLCLSSAIRRPCLLHKRATRHRICPWECGPTSTCLPVQRAAPNLQAPGTSWTLTAART